MKIWTAIDKSGKSIIDVFMADNATEEQVKAEVRRQLNKNSSRRAGLQMWKEGGEKLEKA
jgi:hypothetical protein